MSAMRHTATSCCCCSGSKHLCHGVATNTEHCVSKRARLGRGPATVYARAILAVALSRGDSCPYCVQAQNIEDTFSPGGIGRRDGAVAGRWRDRSGCHCTTWIVATSYTRLCPPSRWPRKSLVPLGSSVRSMRSMLPYMSTQC